VSSEQAASEQAASEQAASEQAASEQMRAAAEIDGELDARVRVEQQSFACLMGAIVWVVLRALGPGGLRLVDSIGDDAPIGAFIALVGCGTHVLALVALAFRPPASPWGGPVPALSLGLGWALGPWTLLVYALWMALQGQGAIGVLLFAIGVPLSGVASSRAARRLLEARDAGQVWAPLVLHAGRALALLLLAASLLSVVRAGLEAARLRVALSDATLAVSLAFLVVASPMVRWPARLGRGMPRVCVGVWAVTLALLGISPEVRATVKSAPLVAGVVGLALR
jgi:hypothetical protein